MISSPANDQIKNIRRLMERKGRAASGSFYLEGLRIVGDALAAGAEVEQLVIAPELLESEYGRKLAAEFSEAGGRVLDVSADVFRRLAMKERPQGIAAVVRQKWFQISTITPSAGKPWVALDSVADPGNLGTILRTNDGAGGEGVILLGESTDPFDPTAVRASMGALFSQKVVRASLDEFTAWKRSTGVSLVGTSDKAELDYHAYRYADPLVIMMGSERQGISASLLKLCDATVSIPMLGKSDSLNLAAATAVILYEILNQRRGEGKI